MSADLNQQIRELMERGLRPVPITDIKTRALARPGAPRKPAARSWLRGSRLALAGAAAIAVSAVLAVSALLPSNTGGNAGRDVLTAWTIQRDSHGTVKVTIMELRNPAGLQRRLRADGVPAKVAFLGHSFMPTTSSSAIPKSCQASHTSDKAKALLQGKIMPEFPFTPTGAVLVIRPSAIARDIGLCIEAWAASPGAQAVGSTFDLQVNLVIATPQRTGP